MTAAPEERPAGGGRIEARDLRKSYDGAGAPVEVLRGVSLSLAPGEALAVTGPSGSGKSTLLHLLGTLDRPTSGALHFDGRDPFALPEPELARFRNEVVGFVFQDHHLLPQYSVLENVLLPTLAFRRPEPERGAAVARARDLLARVGLAHRLEHRPAQLSGGERQRAAVARALINRPRLLLGDEPTGNLDRRAAAAVAELLLELPREAGVTLVVVTHSLEVAGGFPRRAELDDGRLAETAASVG
jgi:lipoprotein-releasing system ATP-binding protein